MFSIDNAAGLQFEFNQNGSLRHLRLHDVHVNLFVGNEVEGGPANLWLRLHDTAAGEERCRCSGPQRDRCACARGAEGPKADGDWRGLRCGSRCASLPTRRPGSGTAGRERSAARTRTIDLLHAAGPRRSRRMARCASTSTTSASTSTTRRSQHRRARHGARRRGRTRRSAAATRGALVGSLRRGASYATDALQVHRPGGARRRAGARPGRRPARRCGCSTSTRWPRCRTRRSRSRRASGSTLGFFGCLQADHPTATTTADLRQRRQRARAARSAARRSGRATSGATASPRPHPVRERAAARGARPRRR